MAKREKRAFVLANVEQLVQFDDIDTVNVLLSSGDWVLVNSYYDRRLNVHKPVYTVGRLKKGGAEMRLNLQALERAMARKGIGKFNLCKEAKVSLTTLNRYIVGTKARPEVIGRLASTLKVDAAELILADDAKEEKLLKIMA